MKILRIKFRTIITLILIFIVLAIGIIYVKDYVEKTIYPIDHIEYVEKYSDEFNLDKWLVLSIIWVESKFDSDATSSKDARGLMQVTPKTGKWASEKMGMEDFDSEMLYDPETNIRIGCWYLDNLRTQFDGRIELVVAAYNGGSGNVTSWLKNSKYSDDGMTLKKIPFEETKDYVERVFNTYDKYKEIYLKDDITEYN